MKKLHVDKFIWISLLLFISVSLFCLISLKVENNKLDQKKYNGPEFHEVINQIKLRDSLAFISKGIILEEITKTNCITNQVVFVFSETNCNVCLEQEFSVISEISYNFDVTILANHSNFQLLKQLLNNYNIKSKGIFLKETRIPIDSTNVPYYLIVNKDGKIIDVFIPIKSRADLTEQFFNLLLTHR